MTETNRPRTPGEMLTPELVIRPRRLRRLAGLRALVTDYQLSVNDLVLPVFIKHGNHIKNPISSMPGQFQWSIDRISELIEQVVSLRIPAIMLFGLPEKKDALGSDTYHPEGIIQRAVRHIKTLAPDLVIITDVCFCEYTTHGHCGALQEKAYGEHELDNDQTLLLLAKQAISHAEAGADVLAPSGMTDGMVKTIRTALDTAEYKHIPILSYSIKYASSFYGPFRDAADGAPQFGDRSDYQMDIRTLSSAFREAELDIQEGADMLMVKPAGMYLDIIYRIKQAFPSIPMSAYQVSGEYAMLKSAAMSGWLDEPQAVIESLLAIKRSGAQFIITYFALDAARILREKQTHIL